MSLTIIFTFGLNKAQNANNGFGGLLAEVARALCCLFSIATASKIPGLEEQRGRLL